MYFPETAVISQTCSVAVIFKVSKTASSSRRYKTVVGLPTAERGMRHCRSNLTNTEVQGLEITWLELTGNITGC